MKLKNKIIIISILNILLMGYSKCYGAFELKDSMELFTVGPGNSSVDFYIPMDNHSEEAIVFKPSLIKSSKIWLEEYPYLTYVKVIIRISRSTETKYSIVDIDLCIEEILDWIDYPGKKSTINNYNDSAFQRIDNGDNRNCIGANNPIAEKEEASELRDYLKSMLIANLRCQIENMKISSVPLSNERTNTKNDYIIEYELINRHE